MPGTYQAVYDSWLADPRAFWAAAADDVQWDERWTTVLDDTSKRDPSRTAAIVVTT